ncbi:hypothetical protein HYALB_00010670 [Hymenoscyphus albidus]|uniref:Uncharacterized protein n=1 Tax=Hymenoscyphus albidus TaxID=595503 RepID=A0A9N9LBH1_9HELO|nr:hypothetical protein HYALB_00010670 [Hymenoscyphus albidus]
MERDFHSSARRAKSNSKPPTPSFTAPKLVVFMTSVLTQLVQFHTHPLKPQLPRLLPHTPAIFRAFQAPTMDQTSSLVFHPLSLVHDLTSTPIPIHHPIKHLARDILNLHLNPLTPIPTLALL